MLEGTFKSRYFRTLFYNILNSFISFLTSIVIIRYLTPSEYGNYQFLMAIFVAVFTFSNLNTQNGYFTFIAQQKESLTFYRDYFLWEIFQLSFIILVTIFIFFSKIIDIFIDLDLKLILVALLAVFFTKNIREFITNTYESQRFTNYYLKSIFILNLLNLLIIFIVSKLALLDIALIFIFIIIEFLLYLVISIMIFFKHKEIFINNMKDYTFRINIMRFYKYSKPLFFSSLAASAYLFLERWFLQKYGGSEQQAYLSLAIQFSTIILILTTSIVKVFWKEVSETLTKSDFVLLEEIFTNAIKNIYIMTSVLSLFFIINAKEIIFIIYGEKYIGGIIVFMIISFYTIHQTLGQLYGTFLLASEETKYYSYISMVSYSLAIPCMYFAVSPQENYGLNLGAQGVAIVMVIIQLLSVNSLGYYIKKKFQFKSMFLFQVQYLIFFGVVLFLISSCVKWIFSNLFLQISGQLIILSIFICALYYKKLKGLFFVSKI